MKHGTWVVRDGILSRGTPAKDRRSSAIHEAAHAVVAHTLRGCVKTVKLDPKNPRNGETYYTLRKRRGRHDPVTVAVTALAGHEAEHRICGRPLSLLPAGDYATVLNLGCSRRTANLIGWLTRQYVRWAERDIRRVARALLKRGSLNRRQFLAALREKAA